MMGSVFGLLVIGVIAGYLARLLVPGPDPLGFISTVLVGIAGSFLGGFLGWALFGTDSHEGAFQRAGIIGSVIGAIIVLLIYNSFYANRGSRV
jgi:uncharacterized membrane protein YeaQ/YmgE (transglycosylase-associated protein family)